MPETPKSPTPSTNSYTPFIMPKLNKSKLVSKDLLNHNTVQIELARPKGFDYKIGQFISLKVNNSNFRAYSLVSHPTEKTLKMAISVGHTGIGADFIKNAQIGQDIEFIGPAGKFTLAVPPAKNLLFLATGTGIAPFIPMLKELLEQNVGSESKIELYYGVKTQEDILYFDLLNDYKSHFTNFDFTICLSQEKIDSLIYGRLTGKYIVTEPKSTQVYLCGHPNMVEENVRLLKKIGVPVGAVFFEKFTIVSM
jgi:ferredoxin-NADP reductase